MKLRKITALFLAVLFIFASAISTQAAETEVDTGDFSPYSITIASCVFRDFTYNTASSTITLSRNCNFVSVKVTCPSGSDPSMLIVITDLSNNGDYNTVLPFKGDGSTTTFETYFGSGSYRITLYGSNMNHSLGLVAFST